MGGGICRRDKEKSGLYRCILDAFRLYPSGFTPSAAMDELTPVFITESEERTLKPNVYNHLCHNPAAGSRPNPLKHHQAVFKTPTRHTQPKVSWLRPERNHWVPGRQKSRCAVLIYKSEDELHFFWQVSVKRPELQPKIRESKNSFLRDGQRCLRRRS